MELTNPVRILLAEDDPKLSLLVSEYLVNTGFQVDVEADGGRVEQRIAAGCYDLLILDVKLPNKTGFEIVRNVRRVFRGGILMLTARDEDIDQVLGLELGADDYIIKPTPPRVLLARITAMQRRLESRPDVATGSSPEAQSRILRFGQLRINGEARMVDIGERRIELTTSEFELLWLLVQHAGEVLSRDNISHALRGFDYDGDDRTIDLRISRLRKKMGDNAVNPEKIKTVRSKGYLFNRYAWEQE